MEHNNELTNGAAAEGCGHHHEHQHGGEGCGHHHEHQHGEGCGHHHEHGDDDCDCGHDHEQDRISITLEDGSEMQCNVLGVFDVEDKEYIALLPDQSEEVLIYSFSQSEDDIRLSLIETDKEFEKVSAVFYSFFEDSDEDEDDEE